MKHQKHGHADPSSVLYRVHQRLRPDTTSTIGCQTEMSRLGESLNETQSPESKKTGKCYLGSDELETPYLGSNQSGLSNLELKQSKNPHLEPKQSKIPNKSASSTNIPHLRSNESDIPNLGSSQNSTINLESIQSNIPLLASNQTNIPHLESNQTNVPPHLKYNQKHIPHLESNEINIYPHLELNQISFGQSRCTLINTPHLKNIHLRRYHAKNCQPVVLHHRTTHTSADDQLQFQNSTSDASQMLKSRFGKVSCPQIINETPAHKMLMPTTQEEGMSSASSGTSLKMQLKVLNKWLLFAVVVLALGGIHLHLRLKRLEQFDRWPVVECHCQEGKISPGVKQHTGHEMSKGSKIDDKDVDRKIWYSPDPAAKKTVSDMVQLGNNNTRNKRASMDGQDISETPIHIQANNPTTLTREVGHGSVLLSMLTKTSPIDPVTTKPHILLRFNRSANPGKGKKAKSDSSKRGKDKSKHNSDQKTKTEHQDKADVFDVPFDQQINRKQYFTREYLDESGNCAPVPRWGSGVKACKDTTVKFQHPNSVLPFFQYTHQTLAKKKRNIQLSNGTGTFQTMQAGYYLVHLNMTLVYEETEEATYYQDHYLTLCLNGQAMFSCRDNRFRCPHMNHKSSSKYMVCNILGMLQLRETDTIDVRTAGANMAMRTSTKHRHSYLTFIQIQKSR